MKKISILLLTALSCSFAFLSCGFQNLQAPKEVKVKTDATYEFSVMNFDSEKEGSKLNLSKYFDFGKTLEEKSKESADSSNMKVYKYNNGSQYQQYLIHMPLKEVEFDFAESFKEMEFSKAVQSVNIDKEVKIPEVDGLDDTKPVELYNIMEALNNAVHFTGSTNTSPQIVKFLPEGAPPFEKISYTSGEIVITTSVPVYGKMILCDENDIPISSGTFSNSVARIPLTGITLDSTKTKIKYEGEYTGKSFDAVIYEKSIIDTAEGIDITVPAANQPTALVSFPITLDEKLTNVKITKGKMDIVISEPASWTSGIISDWTVDVGGALSPGKQIKKGDTTDDNLNNQSLTEGNIIASAKVTLDLSGGKKIVFGNKPTVHVTTNIQKISAEVIMDEGFATHIDKETDPKDLKAYVNKITWAPSETGNPKPGFKVTARNNLPPGNHMELELGSDDLCVPTSSITIYNPTEPLYAEEYVFTRDTAPNNVTDFSTNPTITVTGDLTLPTGSTANTVKVVDVVPGETYNIYVHVEPVFEWTQANVKTTNFQSNMKNSMNTGMNRNTLFASLGEEFAQKMKIREIPSYLYINVPEALMDDNHLEGTIRAFYGETNPSPNSSDPNDPKYVDVDPKVETYIYGTAGTPPTPATIPTKDYGVPDFEINEQGEATHVFGTKDFDFANAMNMYSQTGTLCLDYDMQMTGGSGTSNSIDIEPEDLEQGKSSIKMDVVMILTMDFNLNDTISIDMLSLAKKTDSDLLGRKEASSNDTVEKFLSVVKTATLNIDDFKVPMTGDVSLAVDMYKDGNKVEKQVGSGETYSLEVNPLTLIQTYPLQPEIKFVIGKPNQNSNFGILRTMPISGKIRLRIEADGEIPVYSSSDND